MTSEAGLQTTGGCLPPALRFRYPGPRREVWKERGKEVEPHCWLFGPATLPWIRDAEDIRYPEYLPPLHLQSDGPSTLRKGVGGGEVDHSLLEWCTFPHRLWEGENRLKPEESLGFVLCSPLKLGWQTSGSSLLLLIIIAVKIACTLQINQTA